MKNKPWSQSSYTLVSFEEMIDPKSPRFIKGLPAIFYDSSCKIKRDIENVSNIWGCAKNHPLFPEMELYIIIFKQCNDLMLAIPENNFITFSPTSESSGMLLYKKKSLFKRYFPFLFKK